MIQSIDLMIAEDSVPATGSGIELGRAAMVDVPILCVYKEGSNISKSLKFLTNDFIEYASSKGLLQKMNNF
ncbi:MAG: hypothetical protein LR008_02660 [Candidatus Pacebacteria bacterium]|nr:hypothetical protein [Candidatus Paceibacterota bacterium]